jgi:hypothetical protein
MVRAVVRPGRIQSRRERVEDDLAISALLILTIVLYAFIFIGLCHWNRRAPMFTPDTATTTTGPQIMPWP